MKFQGFVGPAYRLDNVSIENQRCVNLYPEVNESTTPKESQVAYLKSTDGLEKLFESVNGASGPIRCIIENSAHRIIFVSGSDMQMATKQSGVYVVQPPLVFFGKAYEFDTTSGPIIAATSDPGDIQVSVFVDGDKAYFYKEEPPSFPGYFGKFEDFGFQAVLNATHVAFLDGYFIFNEKDTNVFKVSGYGTLNVDPLDFASSEGDPDKIMGLIACNRMLWIMNEKSTEVWASSGNADFPFERIQGGFIEKGCSARYSIAKAGGIVFWLDNNGSVQMASGLSPKRISTHAIEQAIAGYADRSSATGYAYEKDGHTFYIINFTEATWCYDVTTGMWHERAYTNTSGNLEPHRASCLAQSTYYNTTFVGDRENGNIYALNGKKYDDNGQHITRLRSSPYISNGGKTVFHNALEIDLESGVGLDGNAPIEDANPEIMLRFSDDKGHTWSSEIWRSIGKIGEYAKRVIFRRLGRARYRIYELKYTGKTPFTISGADIELEQGVS